jgi:hypothetical protein
MVDLRVRAMAPAQVNADATYVVNVSYANKGWVPSPDGWVQVTLPAGTALEVEVETEISSATASPGDRLTARLREPVRIEDVVALGAGARLGGHVSHAVSAEDGGGRGTLTWRVDSVTLAESGRHALETAPVVLRAPPPAREQKKGLRGRIERVGKKVGAAVGDLLGRQGEASATMGGVAGARLANSDAGVDVAVSSGSTVRVQLTAPVTVTVAPEPEPEP